MSRSWPACSRQGQCPEAQYGLDQALVLVAHTPTKKKIGEAPAGRVPQAAEDAGVAEPHLRLPLPLQDALHRVAAVRERAVGGVGVPEQGAELSGALRLSSGGGGHGPVIWLVVDAVRHGDEQPVRRARAVGRE